MSSQFGSTVRDNLLPPYEVAQTLTGSSRLFCNVLSDVFLGFIHCIVGNAKSCWVQYAKAESLESFFQQYGYCSRAATALAFWYSYYSDIIASVSYFQVLTFVL